MQAKELLHRMQTDPPAAAARAHGAHPQSVALPLGHVRQPAIRRQLQAERARADEQVSERAQGERPPRCGGRRVHCRASRDCIGNRRARHLTD